ncbi:hypothetical protein [Lactiplantibacillus paraxiangfangensis]|uniref:hypothetical protein n=1 Tax=Lactiplantibacillus paraxiangfangensis TaxID=3076224 RepID=UPI0030C75637
MASIVTAALGRRFLSFLHRGRYRTLAHFASVLYEGLDRFSGWPRSHDRMSSVPTGTNYK